MFLSYSCNHFLIDKQLLVSYSSAHAQKGTAGGHVSTRNGEDSLPDEGKCAIEVRQEK